MEAVKESLVIDSNSPIPIYHQLRNILKNELKIMTPNQQFYTENNLTKKYSISRHTAIRAVNELVKDGHLYRHRGKGTFVRGQQNNRKFNKIVLFLPEQFYFDSIIEYLGIVRMIQGITDEVNKKNELLLLTIPKDVDETEFCIERISNPSLDGIILLPYKNLKSIIAIAQKNLKPYILLNAKEYSCGTNSVISDECLGMTEAIEYLVSFGHKNIAFVGRQSENVFGRFCGYKQALKQNDIFFDEQRVISW
ncbi:MAG: GntR family transcriptional regulator, partial [Victivallaceae bacterium]